MQKSFRKFAAIFLALVLLIFAASGITAKAEEPAEPEKPDALDEIIIEDFAAFAGVDALPEEPTPTEEAPVQDSAPVPNVTNVTATQINETQFVVELDSDAAGAVEFDFDLYTLSPDGNLETTEVKYIIADLVAGHNTFTYDLFMDGMRVLFFGFEVNEDPENMIEWVAVEPLEYTDGDFIYYLLFDEAIVSGYTGPGGEVSIPATLDGYPVTGFSDLVFMTYTGADDIYEGRDDIISVLLPSSLRNFSMVSFAYCDNLESISVAQDNPHLFSADGVLFNIDKTELLVCPPGKAGDYVIPDSVILINSWGFWNCDRLVNITVPASVENIEWETFTECYILETITFLGNTTFDDTDEIFPDYSLFPELFPTDWEIVIRGLEGSPAQAYAAKWGYTFEVLPEEPPADPSSDPVSTPKPAPPAVSTPTTGKTNNPKTVDMSSPAVWFTALIFAAGAAYALMVMSRKKKVTSK